MNDLRIVSSDNAVLLLHGLSSSPLEMRFVARRLHHSDDACFVVDLYEIQRMRKLQKENITKNVEQARKRNK